MKTDTRVVAAIDKALNSAVASSHINLTSTDATAVRDRLINEVAPTVINLTNNEPLWQSRVLWGALLSAIGGTAALIGYPLSAEYQNRVLETIMLWVMVGGLVSGPALTWWGRLRARKPIGT
ncbi:hypothetical protein FPY71_07305 [Aureimonas fodinaquatilis]|uniref:Uncharacterized protein n=1 Tax=Aureimonas fodinaquatilis TaxID=2565783 RepID=A0A5B0DU85_9HYPH|nr:hypothetical protein [Aureimonas fodinaquatilis]KAA0970324.1 hypothetical protein FPY71_07305 [Aureimonas fodinaquatilis]